MLDQTQVEVKFNNKVSGQAKIDRYNQSLISLKNTINSLPKNINLGGTNYEKKLTKTNELLINLNKNMSSFKRSTTSAMGNMSKSVKESASNLSKLNSKINSNNDSLNETGIKYQKAFDYTKIMLMIKAMGQLTQRISSFTKKSADYLENWNLLDVAFQNNTNEAQKFTNTLTEMYGLDESWGYRTVGIFKQLANAMGLTDEIGTKMSKTLTQLAIDTSSLYNIDVNDTVSILQSGLAGQTKPVRRLGADITQNTLQVVLDTYGVERSIETLSYAEKRLTIVAALLNQTQESFGDWGRTINCGFILKKIMKNFVNLCKKGVNIFKCIFANDEALYVI